jgi:hypothetical protein
VQIPVQRCIVNLQFDRARPGVCARDLVQIAGRRLLGQTIDALEASSVVLTVLEQCAHLHRQVVRRIPESRYSSTVVVVLIDVRASLGRQDLVGLRIVDRAGVIDITGVLTEIGTGRDPERVGHDRPIECASQRVAVAAMIDTGAVHLDSSRILLQIGLDGHIFEQSADSGRAVERSLGTPQNLDLLQVGRIEIRGELARVVARHARANRRVINIDADRRPGETR